MNLRSTLIKKSILFGVIPNGLVSPDLLIEKGVKVAGSNGLFEYLSKSSGYSLSRNSKYYVLVQSIMHYRVTFSSESQLFFSYTAKFVVGCY